MTRIRFILLIISICFFNLLAGQEKIGIDDLYHEEYLAYKISNDKLFSGVAQKVRKNGHVVYEENYKNGILIKSTVFYNGKEIIPDKVILYYKKSFTPKTEIYYSLKDPIIEYRHFNKKGKKTLAEIYTNDVLSYRCEYLDGEKHGTEFCINEDGTTWEKKYLKGKKNQINNNHNSLHLIFIASIKFKNN